MDEQIEFLNMNLLAQITRPQTTHPARFTALFFNARLIDQFGGRTSLDESVDKSVDELLIISDSVQNVFSRTRSQRVE